MVLGILSSNLKHRSNLIWVYNNTKLKENINFRIPKQIIQPKKKKQANNKTENTNNKKQINQENTAELLHLKSDLNIKKKKTFKFHFYGYFYYVYLGIIKIKIIEIPKTVSYTN